MSQTGTETSNARRASIIVALIAAGEAVFVLPFVLTRVFRPTFLDVFGITNLELGTAFSFYGIVAMLATGRRPPPVLKTETCRASSLASLRRIWAAAVASSTMAALCWVT